jgi:hypothetical protein
MLSPRGSGREPSGYDGQRARGAEGQRISAPVLLFLCESELGLQEAKSCMAQAGCTRPDVLWSLDMVFDTEHGYTSNYQTTPSPRRPRPHEENSLLPPHALRPRTVHGRVGVDQLHLAVGRDARPLDLPQFFLR